MRSFWSDPYLWIHLSGIAALPIFLELCLLGLATGDPLLPPWLEVFFVAFIGVAPVLWMQWKRPFYIFSIVAVSLKPEQLATEQRTLLSLFKAQEKNRIPLILAVVLLVMVLRQLYSLAPIAASVDPLPENLRLVGLLVAALAFFGCNLFLQVPLSVLRVMLTSESKFAETSPYPVEKISQDFSIVGMKLNRVLPPIQPETSLVAEAVASPTITESAPATQVLENSPEPSSVAASTPVTEIVQDSLDTPSIVEPAPAIEILEDSLESSPVVEPAPTTDVSEDSSDSDWIN